MRRRRSDTAEPKREPERPAEKDIEFGPVQVEMLKILLRDMAHTERAGRDMGGLLLAGDVPAG